MSVRRKNRKWSNNSDSCLKAPDSSRERSSLWRPLTEGIRRFSEDILSFAINSNLHRVRKKFTELHSNLARNLLKSIRPLCCSIFSLTLSPLAVNFEDRRWPLQTIWIQMKPHKMWGFIWDPNCCFIWDPNCLTFRLYISKKNG